MPHTPRIERVVLLCCEVLVWKDPRTGLESFMWSQRFDRTCPACGKTRGSRGTDPETGA